jgi:glycosyltransferase involved in cell wall biosynthesis
MAELHLYGKDAGRGDGGSMVRFLQALLTPTCAPRVKFHGHVSRAELEPAIATARVCVFPSIVESFGLAPVEAMALGCPTIFSERCAGPEIIEHGQSGLLVDPLQADQIAAAIVRVLSDTRFAQSCGQSGWKRAWDLFSIDAVLPRLEAYYFSSISAFHGRQRSDPEYSL